MSTTTELQETQERFRRYVEELRQLFRQHGVESLGTLVTTVRSNSAFRTEWKSVWKRVAIAEGGKLSLTTAGAILGAALGGMGVAMLGGAIGVPLAAVLGLAGFAAGTEFDVFRRLKGKRPVMLGVPRELFGRIESAAELSDLDPRDLIITTLAQAFPDALPAVAQSPLA
jgi:hypothetical protein